MKFFAAILAVVVLMAGCATVFPRVGFTPVRNDFPVSASGSFMAREGKVVEPSSYSVLKHFSFTKTISVSIADKPKKNIDLSDDLADLLKKNNGDAIVNVVVSPIEVNNFDQEAAGQENFVAPILLTSGAFFLAMPSTMNMGKTTGMWYGFGGLFTGLGGLLLIHDISINVNGKQIWQFKIEGDIVKRL